MSTTAHTRAARLMLEADTKMRHHYRWDASMCSATMQYAAAKVGHGGELADPTLVAEALREWATIISETAMTFLDAAQAIEDLPAGDDEAYD